MLFTLGLSLADAEQYERAARLFEHTNELRPNSYEVLYNLGLALINSDQLDRARPFLQAAATLAPQQPDVFYRLGLIASAKGETENALGLWQRTVMLRPDYPEAYFVMAEELVKHQRNERAIPFYEKAIQQDATKPIYHVRLGVAYFRARRYAEARVSFTRAAKLLPENGTMHYLVGYAARAEGLANTDFFGALSH